MALEVPVKDKTSSKLCRADVVLTNQEGHKQVIELVVHEKDGINFKTTKKGSVAEHIQRSCEVYARIPGVKEVRKEAKRI